MKLDYIFVDMVERRSPPIEPLALGRVVIHVCMPNKARYEVVKDSVITFCMHLPDKDEVKDMVLLIPELVLNRKNLIAQLNLYGFNFHRLFARTPDRLGDHDMKTALESESVKNFILDPVKSYPIITENFPNEFALLFLYRYPWLYKLFF